MKFIRQQLPWLIICGLLICLLLIQQCRSNRKQQALALQQSVLTDSLTVTTNKLGQQTASIGLISTDYRQLQQLLFAQTDSLGRELQKLATRRTISATIATQVMRIDTVLQTDSIYYAVGSADSCSPVYELTDLSDHRIMNIRAGRDSFSVQVREFEKLTFVQEWTKWKLFKRQSCITRYTNSNPDVEITGLRTYTVKCDCSKKGWIAFAGGNATGFAMGFGTAFLYSKLHK